MDRDLFSTDPPLMIHKSLRNYSTISQAEAYAIIDVCAELKKLEISDKRINVYSDSQATLKALQSHCFTSKLLIECLQVINELSEKNEIVIHWVPGHNGIIGNEIADDMAKTGSNRTRTGTRTHLSYTKEID